VTRSELAQMLARYRDLSPSHRAGLTNHVPMHAIARWRLGETDACIASTALLGIGRIEVAADSGAVITDDNWHSFIGNLQAYLAMRNHFDRLQASGVTTRMLLAQVLPFTLTGLAGASFHGLIRLAYGLDIDDSSEIACGLAYLATHKQAIAVPSGAKRSLPKLLTDLRQRGLAPIRGDHLVVDEMLLGTRQEAFNEVGLRVEALDLQSLSLNAVDVYRSSPDIDTLHLVTASHALQIVFQHADDLPAARLAFGLAIVAVCIATGAPAVPATTEEPSVIPTPEGWREIFSVALKRDAHSVKLVYSAHELWRSYGDNRYFVVAQSRVLQ
jgi:hypothetical protein